MNEIIPSQETKCNVCGKEFQSLDDLVEHFNEEHQSTSVLEFCELSDTEEKK